jgi:hypothetical protein
MQPNHHALLIGVGKRNDDSDAIAVTAKDATKLGELLNKHCHFLPDQTTTLVEENASKENILLQLDLLAERTAQQPAELVLLFFSGHCCKFGKNSYIIARDTDMGRLKETAIDGVTLLEKIHHIHSKTLLVLLNCCHSGAIFNGEIMKPDNIPFEMEAFLQHPNRAVLTACAAGELAYTSQPLCIFTYALAKGLLAAHLSMMEKKHVNLLDLAMYVREKTAILSKDQQHPELEILEQASTTNFEIVSFRGGLPSFSENEFGDIFNTLGVKLNLPEMRIVTRGLANDEDPYWNKYQWLREKNVVRDSEIEAGGDVVIGDHNKGQVPRESAQKKNVVEGSTIKTKGDIRIGDNNG